MFLRSSVQTHTHTQTDKLYKLQTHCNQRSTRLRAHTSVPHGSSCGVALTWWGCGRNICSHPGLQHLCPVSALLSEFSSTYRICLPSWRWRGGLGVLSLSLSNIPTLSIHLSISLSLSETVEKKSKFSPNFSFFCCAVNTTSSPHTVHSHSPETWRWGWVKTLNCPRL